ncbi:MAG: hypothetical protein ACOC4J_00380 [Bacteroidota bacterium]
MKYKVGDKVKVREDLVAYGDYKMEHDPEISDVFSKNMEFFKGKICTITEADGKYCLDDNLFFNWTDEMLEPVEEKTFPREMLVWDDNESKSLPKKVIFYNHGNKFPWLVESESTSGIYIGYKHAKEIEPQQVELTLEDIAEKFNVPVDKLKIKK